MISMGRIGLITMLIVTGAYCTPSQQQFCCWQIWRLVSWGRGGDPEQKLFTLPLGKAQPE